jgi:hypothetical protein
MQYTPSDSQPNRGFKEEREEMKMEGEGRREEKEREGVEISGLYEKMMKDL